MYEVLRVKKEIRVWSCTPVTPVLGNKGLRQEGHTGTCWPPASLAPGSVRGPASCGQGTVVQKAPDILLRPSHACAHIHTRTHASAHTHTGLLLRTKSHSATGHAWPGDSPQKASLYPQTPEMQPNETSKEPAPPANGTPSCPCSA